MITFKDEFHSFAYTRLRVYKNNNWVCDLYYRADGRIEYSFNDQVFIPQNLLIEIIEAVKGR